MHLMGADQASRIFLESVQNLFRHYYNTAKVEQARVRMKYAQEEAELIKQEAATKTSRAILTCK